MFRPHMPTPGRTNAPNRPIKLLPTSNSMVMLLLALRSQSTCHTAWATVHHRSAQIVLICALARVNEMSDRDGSPPTEIWC